jgi:hypothetical protein
VNATPFVVAKAINPPEMRGRKPDEKLDWHVDSL